MNLLRLKKELTLWERVSPNETCISRGGFGSGGSGIGQNRCPSIENKFTDNPSVNRPLIGSGSRVG